MKLWDNVGDPSYFPKPLLDCLSHFLQKIKSWSRQKTEPM